MRKYVLLFCSKVILHVAGQFSSGQMAFSRGVSTSAKFAKFAIQKCLFQHWWRLISLLPYTASITIYRQLMSHFFQKEKEKQLQHFLSQYPTLVSQLCKIRLCENSSLPKIVWKKSRKKLAKSWCYNSE